MKKDQKNKAAGKIIHRFKKERSRSYCIMEEDKEDPWFVYVKKIDIKTGNVNDCSMIIAKDVKDWVLGLTESGWKEEEIQ